MKTKKGWVNIHMDTHNKQLYISNRPYDTKDEAETGIFVGRDIVKIDCIEITYPVNES